MKAINYFAALFLVLSVSCKKDSASTSAGKLKLEFIAEKDISTNSAESADKNILAVMEVKSYNAKTGEIIFINQLPDIVGEQIATKGRKVNVYNGGEVPLFTLTFSSAVLSNLYSEPVLYHSLIDLDLSGVPTEKDKWYILSGYPYGKILDDKTITDAEQLKNFQQIKSNWDFFIEELKKSNRYIE